MAIVVLVLWLATATAGVTLLRSGGAARRAAIAAQAAADAGQAVATDPAVVAAGATGREPVLAGARVQARTGPAARPLRPDGRPPAGPHVRVQTPAGEHPLLEFSHPALAVTGIACWMMFTFVHYRPMAWIAVAILVTTLLVGLGWLIRNRRAAPQTAAAWRFPARLVWIHGLVAGSSFVLTVLAALAASRA